MDTLLYLNYGTNTASTLPRCRNCFRVLDIAVNIVIEKFVIITDSIWFVDVVDPGYARKSSVEHSYKCDVISANSMERYVVQYGIGKDRLGGILECQVSSLRNTENVEEPNENPPFIETTTCERSPNVYE